MELFAGKSNPDSQEDSSVSEAEPVHPPPLQASRTLSGERADSENSLQVENLRHWIQLLRTLEIFVSREMNVILFTSKQR